jgi:hypothetical protein
VKAATLGACALVLSAALAHAQTSCATKRAVVDSARDDVLMVLKSDRPLVVELRQEQGLKAENLAPVVVTDRAVCARMAPAFKRVMPPGVEYAVLRVGSLYYARDPDQRESTGVLTDSTFRVVMRFGSELPAPAPVPASASRRP